MMLEKMTYLERVKYTLGRNETPIVAIGAVEVYIRQIDWHEKHGDKYNRLSSLYGELKYNLRLYKVAIW